MRSPRLRWLFTELRERVDLLHAVDGLLENGLCDALVRDGLLKVGVLALPELGCLLHLLLHLRYGRRAGLDLLRELADGLLAVGDVGLKVCLLVVLLLGAPLVLGELIGAPIPVLNLLLLLRSELCDHLVDGRLHLGECVQLNRLSEHGQLRTSRAAQRLRGLPPGDRHGVAGSQGPGRIHLQEGGRVHRLVKHIESLICIEVGDGVRNCSDFLHAALRAGLVLSLGLATAPPEVGQESLVNLHLCLHVIQLLVGLRVLLTECGVILLQLCLLLPPRFQLGLLRSLQHGKVLTCLHFRLLRVAEVALELLLHLLQDAKNLPGLWRVALEPGDAPQTASVPRVLRLLQECLQNSQLVPVQCVLRNLHGL
mmetsp:Transcript_70440/g.217594  ORF Transcript_70440/g.217594 Transcript_70440/m.217594 type:complete len:368 (-) Transcript_70440:101-1204(-)